MQKERMGWVAEDAEEAGRREWAGTMETLSHIDLPGMSVTAAYNTQQFMSSGKYKVIDCHTSGELKLRL